MPILKLKHTFDFCWNDLLENSRICWKHWAFWTKYCGSSKGDIELKNKNWNIIFIDRSNLNKIKSSTYLISKGYFVEFVELYLKFHELVGLVLN